MRKRGQGNIITTVLIILIVLVAIIVVWNVIGVLIKDKSSEIGIEIFTSKLSIVEKESVLSEGKIVIKRGSGKGEISAIKFIINNAEGVKEVITKDTEIKELEKEIFNLVTDLDVVYIEIYPVIKLESGKERIGILQDKMGVDGGKGGLFESFDGWMRYEDNPVFEKNPLDGTWDFYFVNSPFIALNLNGSAYKNNEGNYYMYYSGAGNMVESNEHVLKRDFDQVGLALSKDLVSWTRVDNGDGGLVLRFGNGLYHNGISDEVYNHSYYDLGIRLGQWDDSDIQIGTILHNGTTFLMWYTGNSEPDPGDDDTKIGYAYSDDGISWTKHDNNPLIGGVFGGEACEVSNTENCDVFAPSVIWDSEDDLWKMWYIENIETDLAVKYAYSNNPEGPWEEGNNGEYVFNPSYKIFGPLVWKDNGKYNMIYFSYGDSNYFKIGYATSFDGISWDEKGLLFGEGEGGKWDSKKVQWISQIYENNQWYTYYTGINNSQPAIGLATSEKRIPDSGEWDFGYLIGDIYEERLRIDGDRGSWVNLVSREYIASKKTTYAVDFEFITNHTLISGINKNTYFNIYGNFIDHYFGFIINNSENRLDYRDGDLLKYSGLNLNKGEIYGLKIVYNPDVGTADYYLNNVLINDEIAVGSQSQIINKISFGTTSTPRWEYRYFDNLRIS